MVVVIITGTPGTGKTELAKALARKKGYKYVDVNDVIDENKLIESYDSNRQTNVVDEDKLTKVLEKLISKEKDLVIDSHMSHCINSGNVDLCIITKCDLKVLKKRLENRGYSEDKVRENIDAEIFDICLNEAEESGHKLLIVDTTEKSVDELIEMISK